jgi:hypothetical protein
MKRLYQRRSSSVKSCANGLLIDTGCVYKVLKVNKRKKIKRGEITEFTRHSRKRLQNALLTLSPPKGWSRFGLCITVPCQCDDWQEEWLKAIKRFWMFLQREKQCNFSAVYRVELQERGMPHMHLVMFTDASHWGVGAVLASIAWKSALESWICEGKSVSDRWVEGVTARYQSITKSNSFRYLY